MSDEPQPQAEQPQAEAQPQPRSAEPEATAHRSAAGEASAEPAAGEPEGSGARRSDGAGEGAEGSAGEDAEGSAAQRRTGAAAGTGGSGPAAEGGSGAAAQGRDASAGQGRAGAAAGGRPGAAGDDRARTAAESAADTSAGSAAAGVGRSTVESTGGSTAGGDSREGATGGDLRGAADGSDTAAAGRGDADSAVRRGGAGAAAAGGAGAASTGGTGAPARGDDNTPAANRAEPRDARDAAATADGTTTTGGHTVAGGRPGAPADRDKGNRGNPAGGDDDTTVLRPSWAAVDAGTLTNRGTGDHRHDHHGPAGGPEDTTVLRPTWAAGATGPGVAGAAGAAGAAARAAGAVGPGGPAGGPSAGRPATPGTDRPRAQLAADGSETGRPQQPQQPREPHQPEPPQQSKRAAKREAKRAKRTGWRRLVPTWRMVLGAFLTAVLLVIGAFFLGYSLVKIPPANALAMKQANVYLYDDGTEIARDGDINRENVTLADVSKDAQHAVLAAEDRDFYTESAVDPKAMLRAGWNTATGKGKQSGSTITQQYVKNYYLGQEQTVTRKVKEFFIAIKLDRNEPKDKILEGYLNTSYFGRNAYGIQAAAQAYYGVKAKDLDPARAAYLAALVNAPSEYDVVAHPENKAAAVARWNYVLDGMVKKHWLSASERAGMKFPMPKEATVPTGMAGQRGYLVRAVKDYLAKNDILSEDELAAGGYRITTTLERSKQDAFVKAVDDQVMSKLDKKNNPVDKYVRAGGAAVDPKTGEIVAMYGGIDYVKQYTNNATRRDFQVGSTFKPFVFASAVQNHSETMDGRPITPNTIYDGTNKRPVQGWNGGYYAPENEDQHSYGPITVREATDKSVNAVYAQMAVDVGADKVKDTAVALGVPSGTPELIGSPSIALGVAQASVLDMAEAYATLANHGKHGTYTIIKKITKDGADVVDLPERTASQAISRQAADTTTAVLQSVVQNGTGAPAQAIGRPAAAKTGTAEKDTAAWFAGYTPDLATVVSVMGQDPVTAAHKPLYGALGLDRINGSGPPGSIWAQFMGDALKNTLASDFDLQLQPGADQTQPPPSGDTQTPGTGGQGDGGTIAGTDTGGQDTQGQGQVQGQTGGVTGDTTGTPGDATGGDTTGGTPTTGGTDTGTTTGTSAGGGTPTTTGGAGGSTPTTGGGGTTGGTSPSGGTTGDGGTTTGTDTGTWGGQNPT